MITDQYSRDVYEKILIGKRRKLKILIDELDNLEEKARNNPAYDYSHISYMSYIEIKGLKGTIKKIEKKIEEYDSSLKNKKTNK